MYTVGTDVVGTYAYALSTCLSHLRLFALVFPPGYRKGWEDQGVSTIRDDP